MPDGALSAPVAAHYPGEEMLDVGGRKIQILRGGQGSTTVVFESGLGHGIAAWDRVRPEINKFASTLCYSRAGISPSDEAPPGPRSALVIAEDLNVLLGCAGLKPPYILVGHSYGGASMRIFAIKYPGEVAGLVLVDPQTEGTVVRARAIDPRMASSQLASLSDVDRKRLPPGFLKEFDGSTAMWATGDLGTSGKLPQIPFALITSLKTGNRGGPEADPDIRLKRQLQSEIFQGMDYGMHIVTDRSPHDIMQSEPSLVVTAIRFVLDAASHAPNARPRPVVIVLTATQIAPLLGDYVDAKGNRASVIADGGHVFLQIAGQPRSEIMAESENRFFMTDNLDARLVFEIDPAGQVASVSLEFGKVKAATLHRAP